MQAKELKMALYASEIQEILKYYQGIVNFYKQTLSKSPSGSLVWQNNRGRDQFLHLYRQNSKLVRRGITCNEPLKRALAQKEFARKALEILEPNVSTLRGAIEQIIPFDPDEILRSMTKGYAKLPEEYFFDRDLLSIDLHLDGEREARIGRHGEWGAREYEQGRYYEENKTVETSRGEFVRSKSEALILEQIYDAMIEVHYEQVQFINGIMIMPDFTFEGHDGRLFYWEHVGLLDQPDYARRNYDKLKRYYYAGLVPGDNLILSFEKHGKINMKQIDAIIEYEVVPRL